MVSAEQDDKTPQLLSVNDAINHMNMGNKNTIKAVIQIQMFYWSLCSNQQISKPMTS